MAQGTMQAQVQGLTGLTISSTGTSPTEAELTNYLVDGVRDIASRIIEIKPGEAALFARTASAIVDNSGTEIQSGVVVDVVRTDGATSGSYIPADPILPGQRFQTTDVDSLHYRSKLNPAWYMLGKTVYIIPAPEDTSLKDAAFITYVDYDTSVVYSTASGGINYFPDKYQGLVVLFASCKSLLNALSAVLANISDYSAPTISDSGTDLTTMTDSSWDGLDYDFDDENIDYRTWFQTAGDMIQRQEDIELAGAQIEKISTYITAYQNATTNASHVFDKKLQKYTSDYQWMSDRYQRLAVEYNSFFAMLMGQKQAEQQPAAQQQRRR